MSTIGMAGNCAFIARPAASIADSYPDFLSRPCRPH
jgi:hypothetical protein